MDVGVACARGTPCSVLLLVETRFYREALEAWLSRTPVEVTSQWGDVLDLDVPSPSVIVLDVSAEDRPSTIRALLTTFPTARVVALSVREVASEVIPAVEAGAGACIPRDGTVADVLAAIDYAVAGRRWFTPRTTGILLRHSGGDASDPASVPLTPRERQILSLLEKGFSNKTIAKRLSITLPTVKSHVHNILRKMSAESRTEAAAKARGDRDRPQN